MISILFLKTICLFLITFSPPFFFLTRPTLVLEIVLSCRLVLNLRYATSQSSASSNRKRYGGAAILPWSDNSKTTNPSSSNIVGEQSQARSTDLQVQVTTTHGGGNEIMKLEPNRTRPESIWNAQTLYTK